MIHPLLLTLNLLWLKSTANSTLTIKFCMLVFPIKLQNNRALWTMKYLIKWPPVLTVMYKHTFPVGLVEFFFACFSQILKKVDWIFNEGANFFIMSQSNTQVFLVSILFYRHLLWRYVFSLPERFIRRL